MDAAPPPVAAALNLLFQLLFPVAPALQTFLEARILPGDGGAEKP
jgi:hypothetical protein